MRHKILSLTIFPDHDAVDGDEVFNQEAGGKEQEGAVPAKDVSRGKRGYQIGATN